MAGVDYNETYSPTLYMAYIQFILTIACQENLELHQINVKGAYLNEELERDIYMR